MTSYRSVVDYDAWVKGYMPPTEHVLIDELSHRGAKVVLCATGGERGYWLVLKGYETTRGLRHAMLALAAQIEALEDDVDPQPVLAAAMDAIEAQ